MIRCNLAALEPGNSMRNPETCAGLASRHSPAFDTSRVDRPLKSIRKTLAASASRPGSVTTTGSYKRPVSPRSCENARAMKMAAPMNSHTNDRRETAGWRGFRIGRRGAGDLRNERCAHRDRKNSNRDVEQREAGRNRRARQEQRSEDQPVAVRGRRRAFHEPE